MFSNWLTPLLVFIGSYSGLVAAGASSTYQHYAITGLHTGVNATSGARPVRQNIETLANDPITFALYIQSLAAMQSTSESELTSWYQFAGVHGRPYIAWDDIPRGYYAPLVGYCTHDSVLFPTWHRPYLAGLEQILAGHCQTIAATYPAAVRPQYVAACTNFRIPYWDWASNATIPDVVNRHTVTIATPSGVKTIANPLFTYKFQQFPLDSTQFPGTEHAADDWYLAHDSETYRSPNNVIGGPSNIAVANANLESAGLQAAVYYALTKASSYNSFATQAISGTSIEAVHGLVHLNVGGYNGHMSQLSYAAFDPIFFLHHVNVDRIVALYQAMNPVTSQNPNKFLTPYPELYGTFTIALSEPYGPGPYDTLATPLEPWSTDTKGTAWTSQSCEALSTLGYTYPEIQDWSKTPSQLAKSVIAQVNTLYSNQAFPATPATSHKFIKRAMASGSGQQVIEWSVAISVPKFQLGGKRFIVRLFLGNVPSDPSTWATSSSCVGSFAVFPPSQVPAGLLPDTKAYNEISLGAALKGVGNDGQDVQGVVAYLTSSLQWRVQLLNGSVVPVDQYPNLDVVVQEDVVTLPGSVYELPTYGQTTAHPEITEGKQGGYTR